MKLARFPRLRSDPLIYIDEAGDQLQVVLDPVVGLTKLNALVAKSLRKQQRVIRRDPLL